VEWRSKGVTDRHLRWSEIFKKKGKALLFSSFVALEGTVGAAGYGLTASSDNLARHHLQLLTDAANHL
jgi:hypothetical protein